MNQVEARGKVTEGFTAKQWRKLNALELKYERKLTAWEIHNLAPKLISSSSKPFFNSGKDEWEAVDTSFNFSLDE